jgi:DNA-directed RNA polymerase subunit RPC12/RpoP
LQGSKQLADALHVGDAWQTDRDRPSVGAYEARLQGQSCAVKIPALIIKTHVYFGEGAKRKVLCKNCGAIAEVDLRVATTKKQLGKLIECRSCRQRRVAREMEEMEKHFTGEDENEEAW